LVKCPAVVVTAKAALFDNAIAQVGASVRAMKLDETICAAPILVED
jgi:hypothetical protein